VGSKSWYKLYSLNTVDKLEQIYENGKYLLYGRNKFTVCRLPGN